MMTVENIVKTISTWEVEAGESFSDYFMHDNINDRHWAEWLESKGFTERAELIKLELDAGETCLDQQLLFEVHSSVVIDDYENSSAFGTTWPNIIENYDKDITLWAEYIHSNPELYMKFVEFIKD